MSLRRLVLAGMAVCLSTVSAMAEPDFEARFQGFLNAAQIGAAESLARDRLAQSPGDAQAQFALGTAQFLGAVEGLGQGLYDHGLARDDSSLSDSFGIPGMTDLPFLRLPVGQNPAPLPFTAAAFRQIPTEFDRQLLEADATLAAVPKGAVSLLLSVQGISLDFNRDGKANSREPLAGIIKAVAGTDLQRNFPLVGFDESDVTWLRGYSRLLAGITDILLAHDWTETVNLTFHSAFPEAGLPSAPLDAQLPALIATMQANAAPEGGCYDDRYDCWDDIESPEEQAAKEKEDRCYAAASALEFGGIGDLVAFVHLFRWPVVEPDRLLSARQHFLTMIALSRESWASIRAETDDAGEWVPGPHQTGPFPNLRVTETTVAGWMSFLDQAEGVLEGRLLLPHWRFDRSQGLNLRRMFEEPRTLDPVMILTGAIPYMEAGPLAGDATMETGMDLIDGGLLAYFLWFN